MLYFHQLEKITAGKNLQLTEDAPISVLAIDSRKVATTRGTLFFAIRGNRHDGHGYIHELYHKGIRHFVVEHPVNKIELLPEANVLLVSSAADALQKVTGYHRSQFNIPVIGITGSNGKTIIKEWLYQMLSHDRSIVKNPGSYNSQVGVPLSVWQIQSHHQLGIFEAGISKPGEMEKLAAVIKPTIGLFSNIGSAHDEGFSGTEEKIREKLKLFTHAGVVVYCKDHTAVDEAVSQQNLPAFTWGHTSQANVEVQQQGGTYHIVSGDDHFVLTLPFSDPASVENCFHCVALMIWLGYSAKQIQDSVNILRSIPMRLELKDGINHCQIIDDTYNNDLGGLEISLQFLAHQHQRTRKSLILSDILESGLDDVELVKQVAELVRKTEVYRFIGIGKSLRENHEFFTGKASFYQSTEDFLNLFNTDELHDEVILVKGARTFQFEKIVNRLQRKVHGTVMEIDLGALVHNLNFARARLLPTTKIMVMVKAFAYGSGSNEVANLLQYHKVDYLGVAYADEGVDLRKNNIQLPIMVMNPSEESFNSLLQFNLEPEVFSFKIFQALINFLEGKRCSIHLKLDTGMHRLGFDDKDLEGLISMLSANPNIQVSSIFTHLAGADEPEHDTFSRQQAEKFKVWADRITAVIGYKPLYHILNSPGILRLPQWQFDMVRLGIGLYGVDPTADGLYELKPAATLKTIISQIKKINKGETIGYGRRGVADNDLTLATIAIGYADGFSRAFSRGSGHVLIQGKRAPVIGNVCMDMTMINITGIDAQEGDEVIIFGKTLPIQEVATWAKTIPYEILTNTSERVKRVFVAESI